MQKLNIKYRFERYGKWIPKNRKESVEIEIIMDPEKDMKKEVLSHCQKTIDKKIVEVMVL